MNIKRNENFILGIPFEKECGYCNKIAICEAARYNKIKNRINENRRKVYRNGSW